MKQYIQNVKTCSDCPFVIWNYNEFGVVVWECDNLKFDLDEEKIISDSAIIPDWCPLPDAKED